MSLPFLRELVCYNLRRQTKFLAIVFGHVRE